MAIERRQDTDGDQAAKRSAQTDAVASLRKLRNKIVHVTVSDPADHAATYAEFELPVSESVMSALDSYLRAQPEPLSREPNARLAAALEESQHIKPRFKSAQELFDALEKEGQG